jgi:LuxR family maltose regulon positive regulatory protein
MIADPGTYEFDNTGLVYPPPSSSIAPVPESSTKGTPNPVWVLAAQCTPPTPSAGLFHRPHLYRQLTDSAQKHKLTLVSAPPGYGKSMLLVGFAADIPAAAWLTIGPEHNNPSLFVLHLHTSLCRSVPGLAEPLDTIDPEKALAHLLNELAELALPHPHSYLFIDNLHLLADRTAQALLVKLIDYSPPALRIIAGSWGSPRLLSLAKLWAHGMVGMVVARDLRLSLEETSAFLLSTAGCKVDGKALNIINIYMEGWITGLVILAGALDPGPHELTEINEERAIAGLVSIQHIVAAYLREEIERHLPTPAIVFMMHTSILDQVDPALCRALKVKGIESALFQIERHRVYTEVYSVQGDDSSTTQLSYRYLTFFREYLRQQMHLLKPTAVHALHRQLAAHHISKEETDLAMSHLLAAGDYDEAAALLGKMCQVTLSAGQYMRLEHWVKEFPKVIAASHPWLLLIQARSQLFDNLLLGAETLYRQAEVSSRTAEDRSAIFLSLYGFGNWLSKQGRYTESTISLKKALLFAESDSDQALVLSTLALSVYMAEGPIEEVQAGIKEALELAERSNMVTTLLRVHRHYADLRYRLGDFDGALAGYAMLLKLGESQGLHEERAEMLNSVAYIHLLRGDCLEAQALAESARHLANTGDHLEESAMATLILGIVHLLQGQLYEARLHLNQALDVLQSRNNGLKTALALDWLCALARSEGRHEEAFRAAERGMVIRRALGVPYEVGLSHLVLGGAAVDACRPKEARVHLDTALDIFSQANAGYAQVQAHVYLAAVVSVSSHPDQFKMQHHTSQALKMCRIGGYGQLFIGLGVRAVPVLTEAIAAGLEGDYATTILCKLCAAGDPKVLAAINELADHPSPAVKRTREAAIKTWTETPPEPLSIQTFGRFTVLHRKIAVSWPRASSKTVFQYLLHQARPVPVEELIEVLWPGSMLAAARKNLHQAVAGLRHALEPEIPSGFPSRYVQPAYGAYELVLPRGSTVDNVLFTQQSSQLGSLADLEKAVALYTGDFLADNPYAEWAMPKREQLSDRYRDILLRLGIIYLEVGRPDDCAHVMRRLIEQEPWSEDGTLWLMKACQARGDRTAGLRVYQKLQRRLRDDLDIDPRPDLAELYQQMSKGERVTGRRE